MEPYYTAAFALYKLEFLFRSQKLEAKYKPARFHILLAMRILANPEPLPKMMNSKDMEKYCKTIMDALWDPTRADQLLLQAANVVEAAAAGDFHRDNIRTEPFTQRVIARAQIASAANTGQAGTSSEGFQKSPTDEVT
jgi:hypothetical protein